MDKKTNIRLIYKKKEKKIKLLECVTLINSSN